MKKVIIALTLLTVFTTSTMAFSRSKVREYARFISDRMAYELDLTSMQYDDIYEINYDFVDAVGDLLDDVVYGYSYAIDDYYRYLDHRNEDISYVLSMSQYDRFCVTESFYRPFCIYDGSWAFRPYMIYTNRTYFYMSLPFGYHSYRGGHARRYYSTGFYVTRYHHPVRHTYIPIRTHREFNNYHHRDFGPRHDTPHRDHRPAPSPRRDVAPAPRHDSDPRRDVSPRHDATPRHDAPRTEPRHERTEPRRERTEQRHERTEQRQERTEPRRERTEQRQERTEQRQERTEPRRERTEQRQERTEQRQERTEPRRERTEQRQERTEQRQERTEPRRERTEQRQERTETRPQRTEQRQQSTPQRTSTPDAPRREGGGGGPARRGRG